VRAAVQEEHIEVDATGMQCIRGDGQVADDRTDGFLHTIGG
jgi:hypothetical protein